MHAAKDERFGWHYPHTALGEGWSRCQYEGMKFAVPLDRVRVIK